MTNEQKLAEALRRLLDAHEKEAKAYLTAQVASENFSRRSAKADEAAHLAAMMAASESERAAREALASWEAERAAPASDDWRKLALKFDGQRMAALSHLRLLLEHGDAHAAAVREFLAQPPQATPAAPAPAVSTPAVQSEPIERDESMQRDYIPLPGGWEVQTKGNGSTMRLLDKKAGERHPLMEPQHVLDFIERMAREIHAAVSGPAVQGEAQDAARYRWLRDQRVGDWAICAWGRDDWEWDTRTAAVVDAAIDAAMQAQEGGK